MSIQRRGQREAIARRLAPVIEGIDTLTVLDHGFGHVFLRDENGDEWIVSVESAVDDDGEWDGS